jgi:hypothetical protein
LDFLPAVSAHLSDQGKVGLDERLIITPAGGAQKVHYMVTLLKLEQLRLLVLFDDKKGAQATCDDLVKGKLIRSDNVMFASEAFEAPPSKADIEGIFDPAFYEQLMRETYAKELKGKTLKLNNPTWHAVSKRRSTCCLSTSTRRARQGCFCKRWRTTHHLSCQQEARVSLNTCSRQ